MTPRGFDAEECERLAGWICDVLDVLARGEDTVAIEADVRQRVGELCARHPVYPAPRQVAAEPA